MKASIDVLAKAEGRKIAVLGDMGELGQDTKALHYSVGEHFKGKGIEELFCAGPLSAEIARAVETCSKETKVHHFATREELEQELVPYVKAGDTILVKASHFMGFPAVVAALQK